MVEQLTCNQQVVGSSPIASSRVYDSNGVIKPYIGVLVVKYGRKCPTCNRMASKRIGKLDFCDDCAKQVRKHKSKYVVGERYVFEMAPQMRVYRDIFIKVY